MNLPALPENLRRLRAERRLSQAALARRAGLSEPGYRLIESGRVEPRAGTLEALGRALKVPMGDLVRPVRKLEHVRFRSEEPMRTRGEVEATVATWLEAYAELESLLGHHEPWALAKLAKSRVKRDPVELAGAARDELKLLPQEPIRDPCGLLEDHGVKVGTMTFATKRFFGLSIGEGGGGPAIVVNIWERITVERWIFTLAHELGHLLLHHSDYDASQRGEDAAHENEADRFASAFLMPPEVFVSEWQEARGLPIVDRVLKVKRIFRVSWRTVLHRATSLGEEDAWPRFIEEYRKSSGVMLARTDEPEALRADAFRPNPADKEPRPLDASDFREDRMMRLIREAIEADAMTLSRGAEMLRMPLVEFRRLAASWAR